MDPLAIAAAIGALAFLFARTGHRARRAKGWRRRALVARAERLHAGYASTAAMRRALSLDAIYRRDRGRCGICGGKVDRHGTGPDAPQLDHIRPLARGGAHSARNLQLSHARCNARKGSTWR